MVESGVCLSGLVRYAVIFGRATCLHRPCEDPGWIRGKGRGHSRSEVATGLTALHHVPPAFVMFTWFALDYSLHDGAWQYDGCRVMVTTENNPIER